MAKSTKTPPKSDNLTEFPAPESSLAIEEAPEPRDTSAETPEPAPQTTPPPPKGPGRPKKTDESPQSDFFQQVAAVRPSDWGTRIYLYLYQLEPVCDLKKSGGKAYLMRYEEPITDEHRIMIEQGSGRYRFILAKNKISADASNELARYEFEIYNRLYPPKLNREAWVPDPRNRRWEVLLPKEATPAPSSGADTLLEAMRVTGELRKEMREELKPAQPVAAPAPAADPVTTGLAIAKDFLQMRSENPMVDILRDELKEMRIEMRESRQAAAKREQELTDELRRKEAAPVVPQKSFLDQLMEFASDDTKLERVKKVAGVFGFGLDGGGRAVRTTAWDAVKEIAATPFGANLGSGLGTLLSNLMAANNAPPVNGTPPQVLHPIPPNGAGATPGTTHETNDQRIQRIAAAITRPMIDEFFDKEEEAATFAERVYDLWPKDLEFLRTVGADTIVNLYRQYNPELWHHLTVVNGNRESQFRKFITDFLAWRSEDEDPPIETTITPDADDGFSEGAKA